jgi:UDP-N-acetylmuramoyl-L-alanine---L-glutamate ligase
VRFSELEGAHIGVWGAGREIRSFAAQLRSRLPSARITIVASDDPLGADALETLAAPEAHIVSGEDAVAALAACDLVVRSPGVSRHRSELRELSARGTPITTATSLWLAEVGGAGVIGITGTKGKSTTAMLTAHLARAAGRRVELAGNIGTPALDLLDGPAFDHAVVELSSYQIADMDVGPELAVVTNLHPEHVDWHGSAESYRSEKLRILSLAGVRATVLNGRDEQLRAAAREAVAPSFYGVAEGWDVTATGLACNGELTVPVADIPLRGEHNALNLCAALAAIDALGIARPPLPDALRGIAPLPHRLEVVAERDGVIWVDDSISTTPESTLAALASFPEHEIILVGGGQDRDQDYSALGRMLAQRDAIVLGLPVTGSRLVAAARQAGIDAARAVEVDDMKTAVSLARTSARPGTAVLLSPAAPSYNAYSNFEERARHFRVLIDEIPGVSG